MEKAITRKFTGLWIHRDIWLSKDLTIMEKVFLAEIESLSNDETSSCFASNQYFADFFGISKGTVANILSKLSKNEHILVTSNFGADRKIKVTFKHEKASFQNEPPLHSKMNPPSFQNEPYNKDYNKELDNKGEKFSPTPSKTSISTQTVTPQLEEKKKPDIEAAAGGGRAAKPTKAKGGKWGEAFTDAKAIFDEARKEWGRGRGMGEADPIYWTPKECGQLANLLTALKNKASGTKVQYADDRAFVKGSLTIFLQTAAKVDKYYMDRFTPTSIYSNFNDLLIDIKALINGTTPTAKSATAKAAASGLVMATKENTPPHTHQHFDLLQMALAKYPNTLNYARWFTVEEMERWGAERPDFLPVLHQMWTGAYMLSKMGAALSELEGSPWRKSNSEGGLFSYLVGWLNENYY